jgi:nitrate reductase gamma subunit
MADVSSQSVSSKQARPYLTAVILSGLILLGVGLVGRLPIAWGYALFAISGLLLASGTAVFAVFVLSRLGDARFLRRWFSILLGAGASAYVLSLAAMAGYYVHETFQGRMEWRLILFGPSILGALIVLDYGLYRKLVKNNLPTWRRYNQYISRDQSDPSAMRRTLVDEVVLQRSLFHASKIRWLRHTLIYWGFMAMFGTELVAVIIRDGFPAFGWRDIWREQGNPVRLAFALIFDITGLMIVVGCLLALAWRFAVNAKPERKYSDTPTTIFLLFVVVTGFIVEGLHLLPSLSDPSHRIAFVGVWVAQIMATSGLTSIALYEPLWLIHVIAACGFIAYVPVMRLIHSCATPLGRLANSQKQMLAAKKKGVLSAMLLKREPLLTPTPTDSNPGRGH